MEAGAVPEFNCTDDETRQKPNAAKAGTPGSGGSRDHGVATRLGNNASRQQSNKGYTPLRLTFRECAAHNHVPGNYCAVIEKSQIGAMLLGVGSDIFARIRGIRPHVRGHERGELWHAIPMS